MAKKFDFEYTIIGSGPAGKAAAFALAKLSRKKIAIVEKNKFGGAELNSRDVPYSAGLGFSHLYFEASHANKYGISGANLHFNFPTAVNYQNEVVKKAGGDDKSEYEKAGIVCLSGAAHFLDANTIAVNDKQYTSTKFIIATGAKLAVNGISGIENVEFLTPETAIKLRRLPKAICIVGGGATGCEIAQYFAELGVKTVLIERSSRLLPREDVEVGKAIEEQFASLGIVVLTNARVVALENDSLSKRVVFAKDGHEKMVRVENVIMATGSEPLTDLGLENAGVKYKNSGIVVDKSFQTSAKNIFAIGDVIGGESSTDIASYQGTLLASELAAKSKVPANYNGYIRTVKTFPEVATVGFNEDDLLKRDRHCRKEIAYLDENKVAAAVNGFKNGFVKILSDKNGKIVGATIVAPNASSMIQELALAIRHNLGVLEIASTPHLSSEYSNLIRVVAKRLAQKK